MNIKGSRDTIVPSLNNNKHFLYLIKNLFSNHKMKINYLIYFAKNWMIYYIDKNIMGKLINLINSLDGLKLKIIKQ